MLNKENLGLIEAVKAIAKDHNLDQKIVFDAIACGFEIEAKKRYGVDVRAIVDDKSGEIFLYNVDELIAQIQDKKEDTAEDTTSQDQKSDDDSSEDQVDDSGEGTVQMVEGEANQTEANQTEANHTRIETTFDAPNDICERDVRYVRDRDFDQYSEEFRVCKGVSDEEIKKHGKLLPPLAPNRNFIFLVRKIIAHSIKTIEKEREYDMFKDKVGEIVVGVVRKIDISRLGSTYGVILDLGGVEATLEKRNMLRNDTFKIGSGVKVFVEDVVRNRYGPQILLSRTVDKMLAELMKLYINEIADGVIEVVVVARQPGIKSKVAVTSKDSYVDPVMTCVGHKGAKIKAISEELQGEKIDVVLWDSDTKVFLKNALGVDNIDKITFVDEERVKVVLDSADISLAIGSRGQNIRLASKLVGLKIDVMTEDLEDENYVEEFNKIANMFMHELDLDEIIGQLLAAAGYTSIEDLHEASVIELLRIEGFDNDIVQVLKERVKEYIEKNQGVNIENVEVTETEQAKDDEASPSVEDSNNDE